MAMQSGRGSNPRQRNEGSTSSRPSGCAGRRHAVTPGPSIARAERPSGREHSRRARHQQRIIDLPGYWQRADQTNLGTIAYPPVSVVGCGFI